MQQSVVQSDQVSQVRGFADQRLRNPKDPMEASNRRISIIVQYIAHDEADDATETEAGKKAPVLPQNIHSDPCPKRSEFPTREKIWAGKKPALTVRLLNFIAL